MYRPVERCLLVATTTPRSERRVTSSSGRSKSAARRAARRPTARSRRRRTASRSCRRPERPVAVVQLDAVGSADGDVRHQGQRVRHRARRLHRRIYRALPPVQRRRRGRAHEPGGVPGPPRHDLPRRRRRLPGGGCGKVRLNWSDAARARERQHRRRHGDRDAQWPGVGRQRVRHARAGRAPPRAEARRQVPVVPMDGTRRQGRRLRHEGQQLRHAARGLPGSAGPRAGSA